MHLCLKMLHLLDKFHLSVSKIKSKTEILLENILKCASEILLAYLWVEKEKERN